MAESPGIAGWGLADQPCCGVLSVLSVARGALSSRELLSLMFLLCRGPTHRYPCIHGEPKLGGDFLDRVLDAYRGDLVGLDLRHLFR